MGSLRRQSLLVTGLTLVVFMVIGIAVSRFWMERSMREFEAADVGHSLQQANQALENQLLSLRKQARDYAVWNATYDFMQTPNPGYLEENYSTTIFDNIDSDYLIILRPDGSPQLLVKHIGTGETGRLAILPEPDALAAAIIARLTPEMKAQGVQFAGSLIWFKGKPVLYGYSSIHNNQGGGQPRGLLVFTREISPERLQRLAQASEPFRIKPLKNDYRFRDIRIEGEQIVSSIAFRDTRKRMVAEIEIQKERPLKTQIATVTRIININSLLLTLLALASVYYLFDRVILRKIMRLVQSIGNIRAQQNADSRVALQANKDIDRIATEVNLLLDDLRSRNDQLQFDALHDNLTGLGNRKLLLQELDAACAHVRAGDYRCALLLLMDLDAFKDINDLYGHLAGDFVLKMIAAQMQHCADHQHATTRIGGDEFACVIHDIEPRMAADYAEQLLSLVTQPIPFEGIVFNIQASIGVVLIDADHHAGLPPTELLRKADIAMYASKQQGKNGYMLFNDAIEQSLSERKRLELDLAAMVAMKDFDLRLQPIVESGSGRTLVAEVLARWQHPVHGTISPGKFIAMAESARLITRLDRAIIERACSELAELRHQFDELRFSINISAATLASPGIADYLKTCLDEHALPHDALMLEITESMLLGDESGLVNTLHAITGLGVQFMIDDFGTGYSSLSRLNELPIKFVKIDRSFLSNAEQSGNPMCQAIIQLAHSLSMKVIGEGIETDRQQRLLTGLGCDYLQGYHIAAPMSTRELSAYLRL
jgi:diguanylate cyclase (GGDEF)-like protein